MGTGGSNADANSGRLDRGMIDAEDLAELAAIEEAGLLQLRLNANMRDNAMSGAEQQAALIAALKASTPDDLGALLENPT